MSQEFQIYNHYFTLLLADIYKLILACPLLLDLDLSYNRITQVSADSNGTDPNVTLNSLKLANNHIDSIEWVSKIVHDCICHHDQRLQ